MAVATEPTFEVDLSEYLAAPLPGRGPRCGLAVILADMTPVEAAKLRGALAADATVVPPRKIVNTLEGKGYRVACDTVRRHRRGDCSCPR